MKKNLFIMLPMLALALTSCHKNSGKLANVSLPDYFDETKDYNISFWAKNDNNDTQKKIYTDAVASFEELYPNIHVEMRQFANYEEIYKDVLLNISTDTTPNVCIAYPDHVATYLEGSNVVADITQLMSHPSYGLGGSDLRYDSISKDEIYTKFLEEGKIGDQYYTLPFVRSSEALYINEDYVKRLGYDSVPEYVTWDWIWEVCDKALVDKQAELNKNPSADSTLFPFIYKSTDNMFISLCKQYGYDFTSEQGDVLMFNDNVTDMLLDIGDKANKKYFETFNRVSYPGNFFNKWEAVMCVDSTAGATWLGYDATTHDVANGSSGQRFNTIVRAIPQVDTENPKMISQGPSICVFNKEDSQEVIASWIFSQYLLTTDIQLAYSKTEGYLPVTTVATESEDFKSYLADPKEYSVKIAATKLVLDNVDNTFITPVFNGSSNCRSAGNYLIEGIFNKKYQSKETITDLYDRCIKFKSLGDLMKKNSYVNFSSNKLDDLEVEYDNRQIFKYTPEEGNDFISQDLVIYSNQKVVLSGIIAFEFKDEETLEKYKDDFPSMTAQGTMLYEIYDEAEVTDLFERFGATNYKTLVKQAKNMQFKEEGKLSLAKESIFLLVALLMIWIGIGVYMTLEFLKKKSKR